jgi:PAS domain S-box-containing protein
MQLVSSAREKRAQTARPRLQLSMPPDPARLLRVRERLRDYLRHHLVDRTEVDEIVLAVEEAATNAIRHSGVEKDVEIGLSFEGDSLVAVVHDRGGGFDVDAFDPSCVPDPLGTGGRGLFLICCLTDAMELELRDGLVVRMTKRVAAEPQQVRAAAETAAEEERAHLLLEEIPEGFIAVDWDYHIEYTNSEARRLLNADELEGQVLWEAFPQLLDTPIEHAVRACMEEGRGDRFEFPFKPDDAWYEVRVHPTSSGVSAYFVDITAGKQREREREVRGHQQELLARIVDALPIPVAYVDADLVVTSVNETVARFAGRPAAELVGRTAAELFARNRQPLAGLQEVARTRQPLERVMTWILAGPPRRVEYLTILLPDVDERGELRGVFLQGMDARELVAAQRELTDSHARLAAITAGMTQGIVSLDRERRFLFANRAALELMETGLHDLLGRTVEEAAPGLLHYQLYDCVNAVLADRTSRTVLAGPSPNGRWYDARCFPTPEGVTVLFDDITDRQTADQERRRREEATRRAHARTTVLADIAAAAATGQSPEEVAQAVLQGLALHLGLVAGNIHAVDEDARLLRALALYGYDDRLAAELAVLPIDEISVTGRLVTLGLPYLTSGDANVRTRARDRLARLGTPEGSWIVLAVGRDRLVATVTFVFGDRRVFNPEGTAFYLAIADQLGLAMERAALVAEHSLELARLEAVMEASPAGLAYVDRDLRVALVNSAHERIAGRSRDQLVGRSLLDVYGDGLRPLFNEVLGSGERRQVKELSLRLPGQPARGLTSWDLALTPVIDADGRVAGVVLASDEVTDRVREERMRIALHETAQALTETLEEEDVFVRLLGESAGALDAESAVVCLLEGERLVMRYVSGLSTAVVGTSVEPRDAPSVWTALHSDGPVAIEDSDWAMPAFSGGRALHPHSLLIVPLLPDGVPSGVLVYAYHAAPRRFGPLELEFARRAASFAAQAIKNSRLYDGMRRARRFSEALNEISFLLVSTMDVHTVLGQVLTRAAAVVGADGMHLMSLRQRRWETVEACGAGPAPFLARGGGRVAGRLREGGRPISVPLRDASRALRREMQRSGVGLVAAIPLLQRNRVTGALLVGRASETPFAADELGFLTNAGATVATALENTRLFEQERHVARTLQESLLRPSPDIPGLTIASRSLTAHRPDLVGGDFSDAFELPDGRVGILIGDVQGKGVEAAGLTETVRAGLRALLRSGSSPSSALRHTNGLLLDEETGQFATVYTLVLDRDTRRAHYASAGHPAPLLERGGEISVLPTAPGAPLGTFPWDYSEASVDLRAGDTLLLYTDGLSEARRGVMLFGEAGIREVLAETGSAGPETVVRSLLREVVAFADELRDDLHVLVVSIEPESQEATAAESNA